MWASWNVLSGSRDGNEWWLGEGFNGSGEYVEWISDWGRNDSGMRKKVGSLKSRVIFFY